MMLRAELATASAVLVGLVAGDVVHASMVE